MSRRDALPKQFSSPAAARRRNMTIIGAVVATALTAPASFLVAAQASSQAAEANAAVEATQDVLHRAFAEAAAYRWVYGHGSIVAAGTGPWTSDAGRPVLTVDAASELGVSASYAQQPGGQGDLGAVHLAWDRADTVVLEDRYLELHHFVVLTQDGLLELTVPVTETESAPARPALGGNPTVSPYVLNTELADTPEAGWPTSWSTTQTPGNIAEVVREWAGAYADDNQRVLFRLAGETDDSRTYRGLGGFDLGELAVAASAERPDGYTVTRVTATYVNTFGVVIRADHELLIDGADQPVPRIVAWGARGQGPLLEPGENAVPAGSSPAGGYGITLDSSGTPSGFPARPGSDDSGTSGGFVEPTPDDGDPPGDGSDNGEGR